ncbi:MAG: hypothetical protein QGI21_03830 [Candidatus Poseidoniaceae archaeon]|jgi:hypothetical protein|nr:hypothetical protein [Candidatus Poseidoniaceae archaeon]
MAERVFLDPTQAKQVEEQLFSTYRQQAGRSVPIALPRQDFWKKVGQLLDTIEMEIHEIYRSVGPSLKMQTLQKRQANVRRTASDLAKKRLVAMSQHASSISLRSEGGATGQNLAALDWARHDPAEREFHSSLTQLLDRFKQSVDWNSMQIGLSAEGDDKTVVLSPGTMQLDNFVEDVGGLTGQGPPVIALEDNEQPIDDIEVDEEARISHAEEYPELEGLTPVDDSKQNVTPVVMKEGENHAAALELAPSKKEREMDFDAWAESEETSDNSESDNDELMRIRILQTMDDPMVTADGELMLEAGDIHFVESNFANYLVESGVAEIASM